MLADASEAVKETRERWRLGACQERAAGSGGRFAYGAAANAPCDVETGVGTSPVVHPVEDVGESRPGLEAIEIGFEGSLEAPQGADEIATLGADRALARPQSRAAFGAQNRT